MLRKEIQQGGTETMKQHLLKNTYAAIVALFIAMMALPTTAQAQSIAKQALKSSSGEMPITGNKIKTASAKASVSFPLLEGFESGEIPDGWTLIDANNDGRNWQVLSNEKTYWVRPKSGKCVIGSFSDDGKDLNPDNYLISPKISGATQLIYWFSLNPKYPDDRYQVLASTTGKDISDFTIVLKDEKPTGLKPIEEGENQSEWIKRTLQLPVGTKYIAFRHYDSNKSGKGNFILLDDITIDGEIINYALNIAGTQVTSANCDDLSVIDGVEGKVSYDHSTKTLTLENATIRNSSMYAAIDVDQPMDIKVKGVCKIESGAPGIYLREPTRIYSDRSTPDDQCLEVESGSDGTICMNKTHLIIDNCNVSAKNTYSKGIGISGEWTDYESTLTVQGDYARVTAEGKRASISNIVNLVLNGCAITQPTGATFDADQQAVVLNGEVVTSKVVIEKTPSAIGHVTTDALAAKEGIFTLSGVKLSGEVKDLPKGIYIVNGKKFVKK